MDDINQDIARLSEHIVEFVRLSGGKTTGAEIAEALGCTASPRVAQVARLAIERAIGTKRLELCDRDTFRIPDHVPTQTPKEILSASREEPEAPPPIRKSHGAKWKSHRLHVRGMLLRKTTERVLREHGGAVTLHELRALLPKYAQPNVLQTFRQVLHKMHKEGVVTRLAKGWYAHPDHVDVARRQCEALTDGDRIARVQAGRSSSITDEDRKVQEAGVRRRPSRRTGKPHRLHARGKRVREAVMDILSVAGGAVASPDLHRRLPPDARQDNTHTFHHLLHKMRDEGLVVRLGRGWYCHLGHRAVAEREYRVIVLSRRTARIQEEVRDLMIRRREHILGILEGREDPVWITDIVQGVAMAGFTASYVTLHKDLTVLRREGRIVHLKRGWYRAMPPSSETETDP